MRIVLANGHDGEGVVTSVLGGISCGMDCSGDAYYQATMDSDKSVTAAFNLALGSYLAIVIR